MRQLTQTRGKELRATYSALEKIFIWMNNGINGRWTMLEFRPFGEFEATSNNILTYKLLN
jgi:hypothetical protein